jgi:hypothetical protein
MPRVRSFQAHPERGQFVQLTLVVDRRTYETLLADAQDEGVSIERFTADDLRKCAEAGGYVVKTQAPRSCRYQDRYTADSI